MKNIPKNFSFFLKKTTKNPVKKNVADNNAPEVKMEDDMVEPDIKQASHLPQTQNSIQDKIHANNKQMKGLRDSIKTEHKRNFPKIDAKLDRLEQKNAELTVDARDFKTGSTQIRKALKKASLKSTLKYIANRKSGISSEAVIPAKIPHRPEVDSQ